MAHPDIVKVMLKAREPFPVNQLAQVGALAALDDVDFVRRTLQVNTEGHEQYYRTFETELQGGEWYTGWKDHMRLLQVGFGALL